MEFAFVGSYTTRTRDASELCAFPLAAKVAIRARTKIILFRTEPGVVIGVGPSLCSSLRCFDSRGTAAHAGTTSYTREGRNCLLFLLFLRVRRTSEARIVLRPFLLLHRSTLSEPYCGAWPCKSVCPHTHPEF